MVQIKNYTFGYYGYDSFTKGDRWFDGKPNSAGGISVKFDLVNYGTKQVKYADIYFTAYNAVGDPAPSSIN